MSATYPIPKHNENIITSPAREPKRGCGDLPLTSASENIGCQNTDVLALRKPQIDQKATITIFPLFIPGQRRIRSSMSLLPRSRLHRKPKYQKVIEICPPRVRVMLLRMSLLFVKNVQMSRMLQSPFFFEV